VRQQIGKERVEEVKVVAAACVCAAHGSGRGAGVWREHVQWMKGCGGREKNELIEKDSCR
jgi:hypothetical protein